MYPYHNNNNSSKRKKFFFLTLSMPEMIKNKIKEEEKKSSV
jgi:hypothetical protein